MNLVVLGSLADMPFATSRNRGQCPLAIVREDTSNYQKAPKEFQQMSSCTKKVKITKKDPASSSSRPNLNICMRCGWSALTAPIPRKLGFYSLSLHLHFHHYHLHTSWLWPRSIPSWPIRSVIYRTCPKTLQTMPDPPKDLPDTATHPFDKFKSH